MKSPRFFAHRRLAAPMWAVMLAAWLALARAADAPTDAEAKTIDRTNFMLKYPVAWAEGTGESDYKPDSYFTLKSPNKQETYVQFSISDKAEDAQKLVD
ncbi:MAG TPA: hypothetical protein VHC95_03835, partial [Opitutales bacterium]|nr:hypothetical protein [Opitutales bacterium]